MFLFFFFAAFVARSPPSSRFLPRRRVFRVSRRPSLVVSPVHRRRRVVSLSLSLSDRAQLRVSRQRHAAAPPFFLVRCSSAYDLERETRDVTRRR